MKLRGLAPMLHTADVGATIEFYTSKLGFVLEATWPEGTATWARLRFGDVVLMFYVPDNDDPPAPKMTGELYCYPADIEQCWDELREKVEVMSPLADWDHGMREFHIADCNGYVLRFGAPIEDAPD